MWGSSHVVSGRCVCVEDSTLTMGGRCEILVSAGDEDAAMEPQRYFEDCKKCTGDNACQYMSRINPRLAVDLVMEFGKITIIYGFSNNCSFINEIGLHGHECLYIVKTTLKTFLITLLQAFAFRKSISKVLKKDSIYTHMIHKVMSLRHQPSSPRLTPPDLSTYHRD